MLVTACVEHVLTPASPLLLAQQIESRWCMEGPAAVDILLVTDDSASMQDSLDRLADNLWAWASVYDENRWTLPLDYRIAVTSTSVRSPWCDMPSEDGAFIDTSCRARRDGFAVDESVESAAADARAVCTEACTLDVVPITPTRAAADGELRPRPWIERDALVHNLADGVDVDVLVDGMPWCVEGGSVRCATPGASSQGAPSYSCARRMTPRALRAPALARTGPLSAIRPCALLG